MKMFRRNSIRLSLRMMAAALTVLVLCLVGCGGQDSNSGNDDTDADNRTYDIERTVFDDVELPEDAKDIVATSINQHANVKEYHVFQDMECDMKVGDTETSLFRKSENTIFLSPLRCQILSSSNLSDYGKDNRLYLYSQGDGYNERIFIDGDISDKKLNSALAESVLDDVLMAIAPDIYMEEAASFEIDGQETSVDGTRATVLSGKLSPAAITQMLSASGLSTVIDGSLLAADVVCDAFVKVYINDSNATVSRIEINMTDYLNKLLEGSTSNRIQSFEYIVRYESLQNVMDFTNP